MIEPSILMLWSFIQILMFCELGENVTSGFSALCDTIYFGDWYFYPMKIQRMLPTIMIVTEKPVELRGFGNIPCTREALRKVSVFEYSKKLSDYIVRFSGAQSRIFLLHGASNH